MVKRYGACLKPIVVSCDAKLGGDFGVVISEFSETLADPNHVTPDRQQGDNNSVSNLIPTVTTVIGAILATIYV